MTEAKKSVKELAYEPLTSAQSTIPRWFSKFILANIQEADTTHMFLIVLN